MSYSLINYQSKELYLSILRNNENSGNAMICLFDPEDTPLDQTQTNFQLQNAPVNVLSDAELGIDKKLEMYFHRVSNYNTILLGSRMSPSFPSAG